MESMTLKRILEPSGCFATTVTLAGFTPPARTLATDVSSYTPSSKKRLTLYMLIMEDGAAGTIIIGVPATMRRLCLAAVQHKIVRSGQARSGHVKRSSIRYADTPTHTDNETATTTNGPHNTVQCSTTLTLRAGFVDGGSLLFQRVKHLQHVFRSSVHQAVQVDCCGLAFENVLSEGYVVVQEFLEAHLRGAQTHRRHNGQGASHCTRNRSVLHITHDGFFGDEPATLRCSRQRGIQGTWVLHRVFTNVAEDKNNNKQQTTNNDSNSNSSSSNRRR